MLSHLISPWHPSPSSPSCFSLLLVFLFLPPLSLSSFFPCLLLFVFLILSLPPPPPPLLVLLPEKETQVRELNVFLRRLQKLNCLAATGFLRCSAFSTSAIVAPLPACCLYSLRCRLHLTFCCFASDVVTPLQFRRSSSSCVVPELSLYGWLLWLRCSSTGATLLSRSLLCIVF